MSQKTANKNPIARRRPLHQLCCLLLDPNFTGLAAEADTQPSGHRQPSWSLNGYWGGMTTNRVDELLHELEFTGNNLLGLSLGYDRPIGITKWSLGFELQITGHYGSQDYFEFGVPVVARYHPETPWVEAIESFAFGLGYSHATKLPEVEVETRGESRRNLIYWFLETELETKAPDTRWFLRIHHRSDAWGFVEPRGGSNALVVGLRKSF